MAEYGVDYLRRLDAAVAEFQTAFDAWMTTQVEIGFQPPYGLLPTVRIKEGQDRGEERRLALDVAETAGNAARAMQVTGTSVQVQGLGLLDPIANWSLMSSPKAVLEPQDIRSAAVSARGRLRAMITDAEAATDSDLPAFAPSSFHPVIWSAAAPYWTTHQYRVAVREAAEGLTEFWRKKLGRGGVNGTTFWEQTLATPKTQRPKGAADWPRLVWPGKPDDQTVTSMRNGLPPLAASLKGLAEGLNQTVRNPTSHSSDELSEQEAMERLAAYSFLARLLDQCEIQVPASSATAPVDEPRP
ncbi:TIGR02391 family protein [Glycomyces niveus]|uniref:TIGR02391 family protein n=1 Tax=Glycomyces niveus TaxID=2820287 RepID=A0ABS3U2T3_9ACTN|nr:TIGR02391 family protein [Glycomyces sp. NEAU-S30]MBO3732791.1 TIGR02391 family protein [Glycomyces sp. NEAU-S30]